MARLRAIRNHIIFRFDEETVAWGGKRMFAEQQTDWGFKFLPNFDESAKKARYGIVDYIGPEVENPQIQPGVRILIEAQMWSDGFVFEGTEYWRTDEEKVLGIDQSTVPVTPVLP